MYKVALKMKIIADCWWDDTDRETSSFLEKISVSMLVNFPLNFI